MTVLVLEIADLEGGLISVKLTSNLPNLDTAPVTPAMIVMATILEAFHAEQDHQLNTKEKMH